jgi:hypothetical protein
MVYRTMLGWRCRQAAIAYLTDVLLESRHSHLGVQVARRLDRMLLHVDAAEMRVCPILERADEHEGVAEVGVRLGGGHKVVARDDFIAEVVGLPHAVLGRPSELGRVEVARAASHRGFDHRWLEAHRRLPGERKHDVEACVGGVTER